MEIIAESDRLLLKVFEEDDVEDAKGFWGSDEVMEHCLGAMPHDMLAKVIDSYKRCQDDKGLSVYAVVEKESQQVIGAAGFNVRDSVEKIELIYHFAKHSWGKGYATEAAAVCVNFASMNKNVKTIYASADPQNANSLRILEKIGFKNLGLKWFDDTNQEEVYYEMVI